MIKPGVSIAPLVALSDRLGPRYVFGTQPQDMPAPGVNSLLGTVVYSPIEFKGEAPVTGIVAGNITHGAARTVLRVDTALITVRQQKIIKKTTIQGRAGTIKEYISQGDFDIEIRGCIISPYPNVFPEDDFRTFTETLDREESIEVVCEFLSRIGDGIKFITVDDYEISEILGTRNQVDFVIKASSDRTEQIILDTNFGDYL